MVVSVPRIWVGETAVCIASGPSLTREDVAFCRGKARVIVVNNGYQLAPWADVLYAADERWWKWHHGAPDFKGLKFSLDRPDPSFGVVTLKSAGDLGLSRSPGAICTGRNGGYQAINLAVLFGVSRVVLLGYDMKIGPGNQERWHGAHNPDAAFDVEEFVARMGRFREAFTSMLQPLRELGIDVVNATRDTALTCFPRMSLKDALAPVAA